MKNEENATEKTEVKPEVFSVGVDDNGNDVKPNSFIVDLGTFIIEHPIASIILYASIRGYGYVKGKDRVINELIRSAVIKDK